MTAETLVIPSRIEKPIDDCRFDSLNLNDEVRALSNVIVETETPFTISIQGEWGSGKTSYVNMTLNQIKKDYGPIFMKKIVLNAWDFSQFRGESISDSMLKYISSEIVESEEERSIIYKIINNRLMKATTKYIFNDLSEIKTLSPLKIKNYYDEMGNEDEYMTAVEGVYIFRKSIQESINNSKKKHVVFIDDLDRLHPSEVVEILEAIQVFLNLEGCVFILAVDYKIVNEGFKMKFKESINEFNAKNYFDKLIQLPVNIPSMSKESATDYTIKLIETIDGIIVNKSEIEIISGILSESIGNNPRNLKSLSNSLFLATKVYASRNKPFNLVQNLYIICMKIEYFPIFQFFHKNTHGPENNKLLELFLSGITENGIYYFKNKEISLSNEFNNLFLNVDEKEKFNNLVREFDQTIDIIVIENGKNPNETKKRINSYLQNITGLLFDGQNFMGSYYDVMITNKLETQTIEVNDDAQTIARAVINLDGNTNNIGEISRVLNSDEDLKNNISEIFPNINSDTPAQILVEFKEPVNKEYRDKVKRVLIDKNIKHNRVTAHKYYYDYGFRDTK